MGASIMPYGRILPGGWVRPSCRMGASFLVDGCVHHAAWVHPSRWMGPSFVQHGRATPMRVAHPCHEMDVRFREKDAPMPWDGLTHHATWMRPSRAFAQGCHGKDARIQRESRAPPRESHASPMTWTSGFH